MSSTGFRVHLVDDDPRVLKALSRVLAFAGYEVEAFGDAESFLERHNPAVPGCAIIDLGLPGRDGFAIQAEMEACGRPVVFVTGQGSIQAGVKAMKAGAVEFLSKPFGEDELLRAIDAAVALDRAARLKRS